ncbi:vanadium-dependent haloperoxidase [Pyxidicoccus parkwayensis]|uniref:Vanadium-dependent haloperoxidase n=1 Tax=Pyxidicoccus parkwayensis TaxID=2813578 RepID=A0ABX7NV41_9BACT|nr:vanadium-dependent haloperoxidase [Pyxidicoccus parkwaysis]QSQ21355.1 vanadium-dependent haloperoxidase [Pyxidicoccus parkwaysis]
MLGALLTGCPDNPEPEPTPQPLAWATVTQVRPEALLGISGRSAKDVWAVGADRGRGPEVLHFDGTAWTEVPTGLRGDLWWVHAFSDGPVLMSGGNATVLRYENGTFTRMHTPGLARHTVYGVWGSRPDDLYAVGAISDRSGFIWHYDGTQWSELPLPLADLPRTADGDIPGFFKVWGTGSDVYVVGARGVVLRSRGGGAFSVIPTGTTSRLFTVHGGGGVIVAVGGEGQGEILELDEAAGRFVSRAPQGCPLMQGVSISADGTGWATGFRGEIYRRSEGKWAQADLDVTAQVESLHAAWTDPEGGVWAVGGNVLSGGLDAGALLHGGAEVALAPAVVPPTPPAVVCPASAVDPRPSGSIARRWNEQLLNAIRRDVPRPTVHARNLYHVSAAMWDAWAAYDATADGVFVSERHTASDVATARTEAISYAAYRVLVHRYAKATGGPTSEACFRAFMERLGYAPDDTVTTGDSPRALGNRIGQAIISMGADDGANEQNDYKDTTGFQFVNAPLVVETPAVTLADPSVWQPLNLAVSVTQNGILTASGVQGYIGAHWRNVTPFALKRPDGGGLYLDPGAPPVFGAELRSHVVEVLRKESWLGSDELMDTSPGSLGNNSLGTNDGSGRSVNPVTGQPYAQHLVRRGDFGRVLAEFWADGPKSETPPGHWNVLANGVADAPGFSRRLFGTGPELDPLEWDVKVYLALNGAVHDAAIVAWEVKRAFVAARPLSLIRYMGKLGQSTDPSGPAYNPDGLPLVPGLIEVITAESSAPGQRHAHLARFVGQVVVHAWRGEPGDRKNEVGGSGWIRAVEWMPYQLRTFVTPAFPGFISGHSTFSRSAAEVLTALTGSEYFPGGLGEFVAGANAYLTFERGPSTEVRLQWASYYDAADQAGQSRLWGGIHVTPDDFVGRRLGSKAGLSAVARARTFFDGTAVP